MRILKLHIDGFGKFADFKCGPFEQPVTVFHGANEAGKSTLLEFIRRVLYGFPRKTKNTNDYLPLAGGQHGGSVTIENDGKDKIVTVRRCEGKDGGSVTLTTAAPESLPNTELPRLRGHHSRDVFENVFAFTLEELHDDASLSDQSIHNQIYSAAMGAPKLPGALKKLDKDKRELFLKHGKKQDIYKVAEDLKGVENKLKNVEGNAAKYRELSTKLQEIDEERKELEKSFPDYDVQLKRLTRIENALKEWNRLVDSEDVDVTEDKGKVEIRIKHETILDHEPNIGDLVRGRISFDDSVGELSAVAGELEGCRNSLAEILRDLGLDWDQARLDDRSIAVLQEQLHNLASSAMSASRKASNKTLATIGLVVGITLLVVGVVFGWPALLIGIAVALVIAAAYRLVFSRFSPGTDAESKRQGKIKTGLDHLGELQNLQKRIETTQNGIDYYTADVASLASDFGIDFNREDPLTVAKAAEDLNRLHKRVDKVSDKRDDVLNRLKNLCDPGKSLESFMKTLSETDIQAVREEKRKVEGKRDADDTKIKNLYNQRGSVETKHKELAGEEESSKLRAKHHQLLEKMSGHAREWAVHTVAENLLKEAQSKFEEGWKDDVLCHSQKFFCDITDGRYRTVSSPLDFPVRVTDSADKSKQLSQLSRGTREQLFLSLRFGFIRELGKRAERLPVIVDEVLVNFDPERGRKVASAFVELAKENQVLVFTCHPQIVDWFKEAGAGAQQVEVIEIDEC